MTGITNNHIAHALYEASSGKTGPELTEFTINAVKFFFRKRLGSRVPDILERLNKLINKEEKIVVAKIESAEELKDRERLEIIHNLKNRYKAEHVILEQKVNPKLLGGFRIEADGEVIDFSARNQISQLQKFLMKSE